MQATIKGVQNIEPNERINVKVNSLDITTQAVEFVKV